MAAVMLLWVLPEGAPGVAPLKRGPPSHHRSVPQEPTPSQEQNPSSAAGLAEASQLTVTAIKLFNEGKYKEALPLAKRVLELREAALGSDHERVQTALLNLGEIYSAMKKYGEALKLFERLLRTQESKVGPDDAGSAIFLDKIAYLAFMVRDFDKSEAAYKRALSIREKAYGENHVEFANSLYSLAEFYRFTGKVEKARPMFERAAVLRFKLLGREHPEYVKARERFLCGVYESGATNSEAIVKDFAARLGDPADSDRFGGAVLNGRAISLPKPAYSQQARSGHLQGTVVIKVTIDEVGKVIDASDMCGSDPILVEASLESARKARFTPTKLSGQPVKVTGVITYNFIVR